MPSDNKRKRSRSRSKDRKRSESKTQKRLQIMEDQIHNLTTIVIRFIENQKDNKTQAHYLGDDNEKLII